MKTKKRVRHHIKNRCNGGRSTPENLLLIDERKERMIHEIFGDRDFYEIILFILRLSKMKHFELVNRRIKGLYKFLD
jgi:hypothetical protein